MNLREIVEGGTGSELRTWYLSRSNDQCLVDFRALLAEKDERINGLNCSVVSQESKMQELTTAVYWKEKASGEKDARIKELELKHNEFYAQIARMEETIRALRDENDQLRKVNRIMDEQLNEAQVDLRRKVAVSAPIRLAVEIWNAFPEMCLDKREALKHVDEFIKIGGEG